MPDRSRVTHMVGETIVEPKLPKEITKHIDFKLSVEAPHFEPGDIARQIEELAQADGLSRTDFEYVQSEFDDENNLISLSAVINSNAAKQQNCGEIVYRFMVEGDHGEDWGVINHTCVFKFSSNIETPDEMTNIQIILVYDSKRKVWVKKGQGLE
jgi:hypothetical protein